MSNKTSSPKAKLAMYKTFELHDNHAGKSNVKTEVSIPNLPNDDRQLGRSIGRKLAEINTVWKVAVLPKTGKRHAES